MSIYDWDAPYEQLEQHDACGCEKCHPEIHMQPDPARVLRLPPERVHSPYRFHFNENARALIELQTLVAELTTRVEALEKP